MIPLLQARLPKELVKEALGQVIDSGYINVGQQVAAFERAIAAFVGAPEALCVNSCTSALVLALRCVLGDTPGQRVVTTPMTFVATTTAICQAGAVPVWADVESRRSCQIDPDSAFRAGIDTGVAALMAVAWAGWLPDLARLRMVALDLGVPLILDAAQAFGARYQGKPLHEWADYVCYSFSPTKHITCGDGGALICSDQRRMMQARRLSWFGMRRQVEGRERVASDQDIPGWGYKFNMNEIAASIGLAGLVTVGDAFRRADEVATLYRQEIGQRRDDMEREALARPWFYTLFVDEVDRFITHMRDRGIETTQPHRRNDHYSFAHKQVRGFRPNTDFVQQHYVALPCGWWLSDEDAARVVAAVRAYKGVLDV